MLTEQLIYRDTSVFELFWCVVSELQSYNRVSSVRTDYAG